MAKNLKRVNLGQLLVAAAMLLLIGNSWAMNPEADEITNPNHGTSVLDDDCGECSLDYTGLRFAGSGGQGGRGTIHWPSSSTGVNYGQMCFTSTCEAGNPLYAWCTDLYHPVETSSYGVNLDPLVISADSCSKTQLTAMAYLLAWNFPATTFEDDAMQLAMWKLSSIRGGDNDGLPHFCYDAGVGYPNFVDTPTYPFVNTVYGSNAPRNDWANGKVLGSLGMNVLLPGDVITDECIGPMIEGDYATTILKFCVTRGDFALSVNDTCVSDITLLVTYGITGQDPVSVTMTTDEFGCVSLPVTQLIEEAEPVFVTICTMSAWPMGITGCEEENFDNNQWLVLSSEPERLCAEWEFPADKWLSVELASFDAYSTTDGVDLQWSTASETDADRWEVLRSVANSNNFVLIGQLPAQNSPIGSTYSYADRAGTPGTTYQYRLVDVDMSGARTEHPLTVTAEFGRPGATVTEYSLADAYPNPFNPSTTISFTVPQAEAVQLVVFDLAGREVAVLVNGTVTAGAHSFAWKADGLPSGTYFYSLKTPNFTSTKKLLLLK